MNFNCNVGCPEITVIVPVYEQWGLISNLFSALKEQTLPIWKYEVIVVDNGSAEVPNLKDLPSFVKLIECAKPGSYAARNAALPHAQGRLLVFTDSDCRPEPNWLEKLLEQYHLSFDSSLIAGNVIVEKQGEGPCNIIELFDIATGLPQERYVSNGYAVTANLAIPASAFDSIGFFDATRFSGGDADFCQRAIAANFGLSFRKDALVYHPARSNWRDVITKLRRVKGGQIRAGSFARRLKYTILSYIPPFWKLWRILKKRQLTIFQRLKICLFQLWLWLFEVLEVTRLLLGKKAERR